MNLKIAQYAHHFLALAAFEPELISLQTSRRGRKGSFIDSARRLSVGATCYSSYYRKASVKNPSAVWKNGESNLLQSRHLVLCVNDLHFAVAISAQDLQPTGGRMVECRHRF